MTGSDTDSGGGASGTRSPGAPPSPSAPGRDVLTGFGYSGLVTWAWFIYGFGAALPLLREEQGTSRTVMGMHSLCMSMGAMVAGILVLPLVRRFRRRGTSRIGALVLCAGTVLLCLADRPQISLVAVLLVGVGGASLVNSVSPALTEHHGRASAGVLSEGNAVASSVGLLAPLCVGLAHGLGWTWRPAIALVLLLAALVLLLSGKVPARTPALDAAPPPAARDTGSLPLSFWLILGMVVAAVGVEFACTSWAADLLHQRTGLSSGAASAGLTTVVAGMAVGRFTTGLLSRTFSTLRLLKISVLLTAVGWALAWVSTHPAPALFGFVLLGLGLAGQYPLGLSLVFSAAGPHRDRASGILSIYVGAGAALTPFLLGAVADASSTHTAFLAVPIMLGVGILLLFLSRGPSDRSPVSAGG
ncbi:MAG: hypothetical protein QG608_2958 [Actinomycetota bacterium]|nr:hypothetical protein [Actinomycetota bacterium]